MSIQVTLPIIAIHASGRTLVFEGLTELGLRLTNGFDQRAREHAYCLEGGIVGEYFARSSFMLGRSFSKGSIQLADWILRDDCGRHITMREVAEAWGRGVAARRGVPYDGFSRGKVCWPGSALKAHAEKLGLPIPGTGHSGGKWRGRYRRPVTLSENRAICGMEADRDEFPVHWEHMRVRNRLPTGWDDMPRSRERGWKSQRSHQWKFDGQRRQASHRGQD